MLVLFLRLCRSARRKSGSAFGRYGRNAPSNHLTTEHRSTSLILHNQPTLRNRVREVSSRPSFPRIDHQSTALLPEKRAFSSRIRVSIGIASRGAAGRATAALILLAASADSAFAAQDDNAATEQKVLSVVPAVEDYIAANMKAFDVPGLAIGIVVGDKVVYAKGFGVRSKHGEPVDTHTVFQIGSTSKAFLATTMAIAVDHGKLHWDDRVVDLDPGFQLKDPWVSQEFRVFDLLAQRSSLPAYANDTFAFLGFDTSAMIRSLRFVDPVSSFRTTFAYTNITHLVASRAVASAEGAKQWTEVLQKEIFDPLAMKDSTDMAAGIEAAPNHAEGYRYDPAGSVEVPFTPIFP